MNTNTNQCVSAAYQELSVEELGRVTGAYTPLPIYRQPDSAYTPLPIYRQPDSAYRLLSFGIGTSP